MDNTIALQVQTPNALATLGNVASTASAIQGIKGQQIANEANAASLKEKQNIRALMQNGGKEFMDDQGNFDWNKATPAIMQAAPTTGADYLSGMFGAVQQAQAAQKAILELSKDQAQGAVGILTSLRGKKPEDVLAGLDQGAQLIPKLAPAINLIKQRVAQAAQTNPASVDDVINQSALSVVKDLSTQNQLQTPNVATVDNNQQVSGVNINHLAAGGVGAPVPGLTVQKLPPPTTEVVDPNTGARKLVGSLPPQPIPSSAVLTPESPQGGFQGNPQDIAQEIARIKDPTARAGALAQLNQQFANRGGTPLQTSLPVGKAESIGGSVATANNDWTDTTTKASSAAQDIGVLQNIKKYAPGAITGVASDRRSFLAGIAGLLGIQPDQLEKTNTDLLIKNSNMQALGGNTDAARVLLEGANPNVHMTPEAIQKAADQVIAQRKLALAKMQYMTPIKSMNDPDTYNKALSQWNQNADPRILQLPDMTPQDKLKMKASMTPSEQKEFGNKIRFMQGIGVLQ